jgi:hypothetical protein
MANTCSDVVATFGRCEVLERQRTGTVFVGIGAGDFFCVEPWMVTHTYRRSAPAHIGWQRCEDNRKECDYWRAPQYYNGHTLSVPGSSADSDRADDH